METVCSHPAMALFYDNGIMRCRNCDQFLYEDMWVESLFDPHTPKFSERGLENKIFGRMARKLALWLTRRKIGGE
jgi:hypothetical protein